MKFENLPVSGAQTIKKNHFNIKYILHISSICSIRVWFTKQYNIIFVCYFWMLIGLVCIYVSLVCIVYLSCVCLRQFWGIWLVQFIVSWPLIGLHNQTVDLYNAIKLYENSFVHHLKCVLSCLVCNFVLLSRCQVSCFYINKFHLFHKTSSLFRSCCITHFSLLAILWAWPPVPKRNNTKFCNRRKKCLNQQHTSVPFKKYLTCLPTQWCLAEI